MEKRRKIYSQEEMLREVINHATRMTLLNTSMLEDITRLTREVSELRNQLRNLTERVTKKEGRLIHFTVQ